MKLLKLTMAAAATLALSTAAYAQDKVTIQLKWVTQAQFAGYYVAKDKGFYKEAGRAARISLRRRSLLVAVPT
jgi:NitT/TauT family transport system substrate-binding protein